MSHSNNLLSYCRNEKQDINATRLEDYDYIVVGSGAGGGPLAAKLTIYGQKILLLEIGDDQGTSPQESIPAIFAAASEYAPMSCHGTSSFDITRMTLGKPCIQRPHTQHSQEKPTFDYIPQQTLSPSRLYLEGDLVLTCRDAWRLRCSQCNGHCISF